MELALLLAHCARSLGAALLHRCFFCCIPKAALLHGFSLFFVLYHFDGVRRLASASGGDDDDACMLVGLPDYKDWANWRPAVCFLVPLSR